jgi:hypothetical protein
MNENEKATTDFHRKQEAQGPGTQLTETWTMTADK